MSTVFYMADPPNRRSTPEYHAFVAVRELPSCERVCLAHPEDAEYYAETLNHFRKEGMIK